MYVSKEFTSALVGKLIIKLAPTGMIPTKSDSPYVPITPKEVVRDIYKARVFL